MEQQYAPCDCEICNRLNLSADKPKDFSKVEKAGLEAFKKLHERGSYNPKDLSRVKEYKALVSETSNAFSFAISQDVPDELKAYLEKDGFIFSGLKTHAQLAEARSLLKDKDGNITPYYQFEQAILKLNEKYNRHYLEAEYEFAVQSSQSAANWANLQTNTARYWLEYRTAGDERVRASHAALNGTCLPADDDFWNSYYPPNGWRCRCVAVEVLARDYKLSDSAEAIKKGEKATTQIGKSGKNTLEMFRFNPGKELKLFPPKNAYTKVVGAEMIEGRPYSEIDVKNILELLDEYNFESFKQKKFMKSVRKYHLEEIEGFAIHEYTGSTFKRVNEELRNEKISEKTRSFVKITDSGLDKLPNHKGVVFRGADLPKNAVDKLLDAYKNGEAHTELAYTSTSSEMGSAFNKSSVFKIQSKTGKSISKLSAFKYENEVLFKPGTKFQIDKMTELEGGYEIHMTEL